MQIAISDILQLSGILITLFTSVTAIVISVKTLKQNSKMIEASTRPYISISLGITYVNSISTYLVMKNYGISSAKITNLQCNHDLKTIAINPHHVPFEHINGSTLFPGEALKYVVKIQNLNLDSDYITFDLEYEYLSKKYKDSISVNLAVHNDATFFNVNTKTSEESLQAINYTLQDINKRML